MATYGPHLTDGVITLRPLRWDDVPALLAGEDDEIVRWFDGGHGNRESVEAHVRESLVNWRDDGPRFAFGICVEGDLVGSLEIHLGLPCLRCGQADVAYGLFPHGRGHGYATRAVQLGCAFLGGRPEVSRAVVRVDPLNPPSAAVARRCGFRWSHRVPAFAGGFDCYYRDIVRDNAQQLRAG